MFNQSNVNNTKQQQLNVVNYIFNLLNQTLKIALNKPKHVAMFILHQLMHFFHTRMYYSLKLALKPIKTFKTLRHVSISYEIILRGLLFPF